MAEILVGALVTADDVKEIIDTELTDARIANFINLAYVTTDGLDLTDAEVEKQLQLWLAAHYLTVYEGVIQSQNVAGEYSVTYARIVGEGLRSSPYGQQAIALDPTGKLTKLGSKRAKFVVTSQYDLYGSTYLAEKVD